MSAAEIRRLAVPALLAAVLLVSFRNRPGPAPAPAAAPIPLSAGEPPVPSDAEVRAAWSQALAPGSPGYDRGATKAPVTVVEFADFGCPYCARFASETWPRLSAEFVRTGRVRWRYVPFVLGIFPNGEEAARAAECAAAQGSAAFGRMHDRLYAAQSAWTEAGDPAAAFQDLARTARLDVGRFAACWTSGAPGMRVRASNDLAERMGVRSTPTFFVNGARIEGALPAEQFRAVLLDALRQGGEGGGR